MPTEAERMAALFAGNEKYHGTHGEPDWDEAKTKWSIRSTAQTVHAEVVPQPWEQHISGERPLGIVPIHNDSTCIFGSIDIDDYNIDTMEVLRRVENFKLPLIAARS